MKLVEENEINDGHYLEVADRLYIVMSTLNDHLSEHPLVKREEEIYNLIESAISDLWEAYQLVGGKLFDKPNEE